MRQASNSLMVVSAWMLTGEAFLTHRYLLAFPMIWVAFAAYYYGKRNSQNIRIRNQLLKVMPDKYALSVIVLLSLDVLRRLIFIHQNNAFSVLSDIFECSVIVVFVFAYIVDGRKFLQYSAK